MAKRIHRHIYSKEDIKYINGRHQYVTNPDGCLFSGSYKTKIRVADLPEWYVHGRYYKRFGYFCTKGIVDVVYIPNKFTNHFLKDDCLLVSFNKKIEPKPLPEGDERRYLAICERYTGFDEMVWGNEIISVLKGAAKYSGINIEPIKAQLKEKLQWLLEAYPEDFCVRSWKICDIDEMFKEDVYV